MLGHEAKVEVNVTGPGWHSLIDATSRRWQR